MKVTFLVRKADAPKGFQELVEKKLMKYDRFFKDDAEATVLLTKKRNYENVELTIVSGGTIFRSEQADKSFMNAFDKTIAAIERQIRKNKTRLEKRLREGVFVKGSESFIAYAGPELEEESDFNVRYKSFKFKPMSCEEAILQMNLLEHDFYVFINDESNEVNVVYHKNDGNYGCIIPE